jgi:hypothetical protein
MIIGVGRIGTKKRGGCSGGAFRILETAGLERLERTEQRSQSDTALLRQPRTTDY